MTKKLLLITPEDADGPIGGRAQLSDLHRRCLSEILGERLIVHEIPRRRSIGLVGTASTLTGKIDGVNAEIESAILRRIVAEKVDKVFLNGSNLGRLARIIKRHQPDVEVLCFFHNVEARFFLGALRQSRTLRAMAVLAANFAGERMAARFSDRLITLSARDSKGIGRLYGRVATDILPMAVQDQLSGVPENGETSSTSSTSLLFVGGSFYANVAGIRWFTNHVAPHIPFRTMVVGRGLEGIAESLQGSGSVFVIGATENLESCYLDAKAVIAPIFDGSGMKTKVAEALMFGKRVIGTSEAFSGYEEVASQAGWTCDTAAQWVEKLRAVASMSIPRFDPALRLLYERHHSYEATRARLATILQPRGEKSSSLR